MLGDAPPPDRRAYDPLDVTLERIVDRFPMRDVLYALIEVCYQCAGTSTEAPHVERWRLLALSLTLAEQFADRNRM